MKGGEACAFAGKPFDYSPYMEFVKRIPIVRNTPYSFSQFDLKSMPPSLAKPHSLSLGNIVVLLLGSIAGTTMAIMLSMDESHEHWVGGRSGAEFISAYYPHLLQPENRYSVNKITQEKFLKKEVFKKQIFNHAASNGPEHLRKVGGLNNLLNNFKSSTNHSKENNREAYKVLSQITEGLIWLASNNYNLNTWYTPLRERNYRNNLTKLLKRTNASHLNDFIRSWFTPEPSFK